MQTKFRKLLQAMQAYDGIYNILPFTETGRVGASEAITGRTQIEVE